MGFPIFGADSRLDVDAVSSVPVEDPAFPIGRLSDDRTFLSFKTSAGATTVDIITDSGGAAVAADYLMVVGHDLFDPALDGLGAVTVEFAHSPDDITYTTVVAAFVVTDNRIIARTFTQVSRRFWRLRLTRAAAFIPSIGETQWGQRVEVPKGVRADYDPIAETVMARVPRSQSGQILGAVLTFVSRRNTIDFRFVPSAFLLGTAVADFGEFWNNHASQMKAFLWHWNPAGGGLPGAFEKDAYFAVIVPGSISRPLATPLDTGLRDLRFEIQGVKE